MRKSEYPIGSFLTTVEYGHTFIHDGTNNGDGYGVVIGMYDNEKIMKSSDYGNWCKGCECRPATEDEIKRFIAKVHNTERIKDYSTQL